MRHIQLFYGYVFNRCVFNTVAKKHIDDIDELIKSTSYENAVCQMFGKSIGVETSYNIITGEDCHSEVYVYLLHSGIDIDLELYTSGQAYKILDPSRFDITNKNKDVLQKNLQEVGLLDLATANGWILKKW